MQVKLFLVDKNNPISTLALDLYVRGRLTCGGIFSDTQHKLRMCFEAEIFVVIFLLPLHN
jgi:hypothetical protein